MTYVEKKTLDKERQGGFEHFKKKRGQIIWTGSRGWGRIRRELGKPQNTNVECMVCCRGKKRNGRGNEVTYTRYLEGGQEKGTVGKIGLEKSRRVLKVKKGGEDREFSLVGPANKTFR